MGLRSWYERRLGRRRPDRGAPEPDATRVRDAHWEAVRSEAILAHTIRQDPAVSAREVRAIRLHQRRDLGPAVRRYLMHHASW